MWNSIAELATDLNLSSATIDKTTAVAELRARRAKSHPDQTGGDFQSTEQRNEYDKTDRALHWLLALDEALSQELVLAADQPATIAALQQGLTALQRTMTAAVQAQLEMAQQATLAARAANGLTEYRKRSKGKYFLPKFTSATLGSISVAILGLQGALRDQPFYASIRDRLAAGALGSAGESLSRVQAYLDSADRTSTDCDRLRLGRGASGSTLTSPVAPHWGEAPVRRLVSEYADFISGGNVNAHQ